MPLLLCLTVFLGASSTADENPTASQLMPESTVFYVEVPDPSGLISAIFDHPLRQKIESLEPWKQATSTPEYAQFNTGLVFVEGVLGMKWREAVKTATGRGITFGFDPANEAVLVAIQGDDADAMQTLHDKALQFSQLGPADQLKKGTYRDLPVYQAGEARFALVRNWLLLTNHPDTGKAAIDKLLDGNASGLDQNEFFQQARATQSRDATAWAFLNLKFIRDAGGAPELFRQQPSDNPGAELIAGGIQSVLQKTPWLTASIRVGHEALEAKVSLPHDASWVPEQREFYFGPDGAGRAPSIPAVKSPLFSLSTYRNFSEMWLRAPDLFTEGVNDGMAEADANLTTFFSGRDFGEDILGALTPEVSFIAARQDFTDILPTPAIKLPHFALVMQLRNPERMTREMRRTFQSLIGFFNVVGAMEGNPQLEMDIVKLDDAELITTAYIPEEDDAESKTADLIYNFSPTVGFSGSRFVIASTDRFAREIVESKEEVAVTADSNTELRLRGGVLKHVLQDNQEQLIAQNMLEDGNTREEAEGVISLVLEAVGYIKDTSLTLTANEKELALGFKISLEQ